MKGNETREEIVRIGAEIIGQSGFNSTGLDAVLKRAKVPKGSFYYYFPSKDDFGLAVIDHHARAFAERLDEYLKDASVPPLERLRRYFDSCIEAAVSNQCRRGCLIGNLGQELAASNEKFRKRIEEVFLRWQERFSTCLDEAKAAGQLSPEANCEELGQFILMSWEGAVLRAKVMKSIQPMKLFVEQLFSRNLK